MNIIVNKFLLGEDKLMPKTDLKQPGFTYSTCSPLTKKQEKNEKVKQTGKTGYIYKNDFEKACFQHDMAYGKQKDLTKRTQSDKALTDKAFKVMMDIEEDYLESFLIKNLKTVVSLRLQISLFLISYNLKVNLINFLLENLKEEEFIHHLKTIFWVQIQLICNQ